MSEKALNFVNTRFAKKGNLRKTWNIQQILKIREQRYWFRSNLTRNNLDENVFEICFLCDTILIE